VIVSDVYLFTSKVESYPKVGVETLASNARSEQLVVGCDRIDSCYRITDMTIAARVICSDPDIQHFPFLWSTVKS